MATLRLVGEITRPTMVERSIIARACLRRSHVVGVQQLVVGATAHHRRELPAQVGRIPDAAVVALTLPHRHQVRGVSGEQQPAAAERAGDPRVMGVDPPPDHVDPVGMRHHPGQHPRQERRILRLLVGLVGVNHELESANSVRDRDRGVRTFRVGTDLAVRVAERIVGDVDHQPPRRRRRSVEGHSHHPAGHAAAAVAADDVARPHATVSPSWSTLPPHSTVTASAACAHEVIGSVPPHLDVLESVQSAQQFGVDERLHEAIALRPAETRVGRGHFGKHATLGVDEAQNLVGHRVRQYLGRPSPIDWNVRNASSSSPTPRG